MASISGDFSTGLKFHLKLEETSGNRTDEVSSATFTDYNSVGYNASGIQDNCGAFVSANSEYLKNTSLTFSRDTDVSVSAWVYFDSFGSSGQSRGIFSLQLGDGTYYRQLTMRTYNNGGTVDMRYCYTAGAGKEAYYNNYNVGTGVGTGAWAHVVVTVDYGSTVKYYVNGSEVPSSSFDISTFTYYTNSNYSLLVGAESSSTGSPYAGRYMDGRIDEVSVWEGVVLSSTDVSTIYNSGDGIEFDAPAPSTSISKVSGIAQASVAKMDSVALASIEKIDGISNTS